MEKLKNNNILMCKIINYYCDFNKIGETVIIKEDSSVESGTIFNYTTNNKNLCNISLVCWHWFRFVSKLFSKIGTFQTYDSFIKRKKSFQYTPMNFPPIFTITTNKNKIKNKNKNNKNNEIVVLLNEKNKQLLENGIIPFSKFKLLNLDNVQFIKEERDSNHLTNFIDILKNFKNLNKLQVNFSINNDDENDYNHSTMFANNGIDGSGSQIKKKKRQETITEYLNVFKSYKNLALILDLNFTNKPINKRNVEDASLFNGLNIDTVNATYSNTDPNEMRLQLKLLQLLNPINLNFLVCPPPYSDWKSAHHLFNKEFFKQCSRLKSFTIGNDFLDLQFLNMAMVGGSPADNSSGGSNHSSNGNSNGNSGIESIKVNLIFHDLYFHLVDPSFQNKKILDNLFLSEVMPNENYDPVEIPFKQIKCGYFDGKIPYCQGYDEYYNQLELLSTNLTNSNSLINLKLSNYCGLSLIKCSQGDRYDLNSCNDQGVKIIIETRFKDAENQTTITGSPSFDGHHISFFSNFFKSIENNQSLTKLSLSNWELDYCDTNLLIDSIIKNKTITKITLENGTLKCDKNLMIVSKLLKANKFFKINISNNKFKDLDNLILLINNNNNNNNNDGRIEQSNHHIYTRLKINGILENKETNSESESIKSKIENQITNPYIFVKPYKSNDIFVLADFY